MKDNFDRILDECIDRISRGESIDACLADYPDYARQLEPLLQTMTQTQKAYAFKPTASAKQTARQRFDIAREKSEMPAERRSPFWRMMTWSRVLATATIILLVVVAGYFGFRQFAPSVGPTGPGPVADPRGNFVFLISDDVNAISDFTSVAVSISKIGLLPSGSSDDQWVEFEPEIDQVDLTLLPGEKTQEIWRGNIPEGQYDNTFIYVTDVRGILKETGQMVAIKLPGNKLHIAKPFQVTTDTITSFTYDLTVVSTGNPQSSEKYILKPQVNESGADHRPREAKSKGKHP
ncbi:MAG: DUF4382 domain-containing protein [Dehalococcoidales bacterium]|nr:DUF4382 domain-containing protein [Dehalococcoidales bacterium]